MTIALVTYIVLQLAAFGAVGYELYFDLGRKH